MRIPPASAKRMQQATHSRVAPRQGPATCLPAPQASHGCPQKPSCGLARAQPPCFRQPGVAPPLSAAFLLFSCRHVQAEYRSPFAIAIGAHRMVAGSCSLASSEILISVAHPVVQMLPLKLPARSTERCASCPALNVMRPQIACSST